MLAWCRSDRTEPCQSCAGGDRTVQSVQWSDGPAGPMHTQTGLRRGGGTRCCSTSSWRRQQVDLGGSSRVAAPALTDLHYIYTRKLSFSCAEDKQSGFWRSLESITKHGGLRYQVDIRYGGPASASGTNTQLPNSVSCRLNSTRNFKWSTGPQFRASAEGGLLSFAQPFVHYARKTLSSERKKISLW